MILMFIGAIVGLFGFSFIPDGNFVVINAGAVLFFIGSAFSSEHTAKVLAGRNAREYWAYGKEPDWKERQRQQEEKAERVDHAIRPFHAFLWALLICAVLFVMFVAVTV